MHKVQLHMHKVYKMENCSGFLVNLDIRGILGWFPLKRKWG